MTHSLGLNVTVGAFLARDAVQNQQQKANLVAAVQAGLTDSTVILGSEVLERGQRGQRQHPCRGRSEAVARREVSR